MQTRRLSMVLCFALAIGCCPGVIGQAIAQKSEHESPATLIDDVYNRLGKLMHEFYPKAKMTKTANKIKVEYKLRPFVAPGGRQEIAPAFGGIMCDIDLKPGPYAGKVRLPQQYHEYNYYSVILMAPYSKNLNAHLYTKLAYPSDTPQDLQYRFKELMNEFDDGGEEERIGQDVSAPSDQDAQSETSTASATPPGPTASAGRQTDTPDKQFFWKGQRGSEVVYLLGTIGYRPLDSESVSMVSEIEDAFQNSKSVLVDTIDLRTTLPYSDKSVRYEGGDKLSRHLSPGTRNSLDSYLKWSGETMDMYDFWKPWFAALAFDVSNYRLDGFERVEWQKYIADKAKKEAKPIVEVETAVGKAALFDSLPAETQDKLLDLAIKELLDFRSIQKDMETAWRAADADKLAAVSAREASADPELLAAYGRLLEQRNNRLIKCIDDELKNQGPVFVAVDARNLVGSAGLLNRLQQKGFSCQQIACSTLSSATPVAVEGPEDETPTATFGGARLSRYSYPEGKFSIMLPGKPAMRYSNKTGMRQVEYIYQDTQGAYCVGYIILPGEPNAAAIPMAFDATSKGLTSSYNALELKESNATLQGFPGRVINITRLKDKAEWGVHVRMFVAGKFLYIIAAEGTKEWLKSPIVHQVTNSFTLSTNTGVRQAVSAPWTGTGSSGSSSNAQRRNSFPSGSSRKWGSHPFGPTSPYDRERHQWGRNN